MKCAILQPSYIPWRGYFHQIYKADIFVFYDDVQYDKHGWRNRNRIKTAQGSQWLTIPVLSAGSTVQNIPINKININHRTNWSTKHWRSLQQAYSKAPYFSLYASLLETCYGTGTDMLADFTIEMTIALSAVLGINRTRFMRSSDIEAQGTKTDRLVSILQAVQATHYISGPSAQSYIEVDKLSTANISLEYMVYSYPEYRQLYPPFDPQVSILDLLFMTGSQAPNYIWGSYAAD